MNTKAGAVYLCYFPISDPLVESQVLTYLRGLAATGFRMHLITFELTRDPEGESETHDRLRREGIHWSCLYYRPGGSLIRKALEGLRGVSRLIDVSLRNNLRIIHARAHPAAIMAYPVARLFGRRLLFDVRGLVADEYADIGRWSRSGLKFRLVKLAERFLVRHADAVVFLTNAVVRDFVDRGLLNTTDLARVTVIPTSVDVPAEAPRPSRPEFFLAYVGKLGSWYLDEEMLQFFLAVRKLRPVARLMVLTQSPSEALGARVEALGLSPNDVSIDSVRHGEVRKRLEEASAAVAFYQPGYSKLATSPTKVGEYLSAGLPVAINSGIGDCDELLRNDDVGVCLKDLSTAEVAGGAARLVALAESPGVRERCQRVARSVMDLETVGVARYRSVYAKLSA